MNIYSCGKFSSSPVLCTNSKYVSYVWAVLCLCILTSNNVSQIHMAAYFGYFSDTLHVLHIHFLSASYHLIRWRKQICRFVSAIWVEHSMVLWDWGCESFVWIVWQYLISFFWCYFLSLNCTLFVWTICLPVYCFIEPF